MTEEMQEIEAAERHMFRTMIRFAILAGLLFFAARFLAQKKNEYADLTESEARDKLIETISPKVGDDTANEIADQVIPKLKDRGLIKSDPMDGVADDVKETVADTADTAEDNVDDAADTVSEAVDSVVKD